MSSSKTVVMDALKKSKRALVLVDELSKSHIELRRELMHLYRADPKTIADKSVEDVLNIVQEIALSTAYVDRSPNIGDAECRIKAKIAGGVSKSELSLTGVELKVIVESVTAFYQKAAEAQSSILQATQFSSALFSKLTKTS